MSADKRKLLEEMLAVGVVLVYLDSRREGVELPDSVRSEPIVALHISHTFDCDLQIDEVGVRANLSFQRQRHPCVVPWASIFAMGQLSDGKSAIFTADVPPDVRAELESMHPTQPPKRRPNLRLVS